MKKLLYTTTAFVLCGGIVQANAACIATPSCTAMGYTSSSSCINGIKCPFGEYWNCANSDLSNKITELETAITLIEKDMALRLCKIGDVFYSDMTCSALMQVDKTPIGVVVYIDERGHGQAMALKSIGEYKWSTEYVDIIDLDNRFESSASKDYESCKNTEILLTQGDKITYPAVWAAHEYNTEGTSAGDWCLPAAGIFTSYKNNQSAINTGFSRAGGIIFTTDDYAWTSTEEGNEYAWYMRLDQRFGLYSVGIGYTKQMSFEVRPVLEF